MNMCAPRFSPKPSPPKANITEEMVKCYVSCTCRHAHVCAHAPGYARSALRSARSRGALTWPPQQQPLIRWVFGDAGGFEEGECTEEEENGGQIGAACLVLGTFRGYQVHIHEK